MRSNAKRCKLQNLKLITDKSFGLPDWDEIKIPRKFESCIRCFYVDEVRLRYVFCSTSLALTSTRWVRSSIKLCFVHSPSNALAIYLENIEFKKKLGMPRIEPRATWLEAKILSTVLCGSLEIQILCSILWYLYYSYFERLLFDECIRCFKSSFSRWISFSSDLNFATVSRSVWSCEAELRASSRVSVKRSSLMASWRCRSDTNGSSRLKMKRLAFESRSNLA